MKTLILGASGMLGSELARAFKKYNPTRWDRHDLDITNKGEVNKKITELKPELIINAAAYTDVDACEENEELATKVNGYAVGYLADVASNIDATLVHFSTDYVFDGTKKEGYVESDAPNPVSAYGRSKLAGEQAILSLRLSAGRGIAASAGTPPRNDSLKFYIVRTAWLYGKNGKNFVETMISMAKAGKPLKVIDDQIGSPTNARDLAGATLELVESKKPSGIYHRTNGGTTSWYGFARKIFKMFSAQGGSALGGNKSVDLNPCTTAEFPLPAKRPAYSVLRSTKLEPMRSWQEGLRAYEQERVIDRPE